MAVRVRIKRVTSEDIIRYQNYLDRLENEKGKGKGKGKGKKGRLPFAPEPVLRGEDPLTGYAPLCFRSACNLL